jgi:predicted transcriptional regulator
MLKRRLLLWGFKPPGELASVLGPLEHRVMETVWRRGESTVRDVHACFDGVLAYTTLMTTMDRLYKKGLLGRRKQGRAFLYSATASPEDLDHSVASGILQMVLGQGPDAAQPVLSRLVDAVSESDRGLLDELDRLVREKRRELKKQEPT